MSNERFLNVFLLWMDSKVNGNQTSRPMEILHEPIRKTVKALLNSHRFFCLNLFHLATLAFTKVKMTMKMSCLQVKQEQQVKQPHYLL